MPGATVVDHTKAGGLGSVADVLVAWRRADSRGVRAVFPAAGDVRGLPGPAGFRTAAIDAGSAVWTSALGVVPVRVARTVSSARELVVWHAYDIGEAPLDHVQVDEAAHDLGAAIRESASALSAAEVAGRGADVREELDDARRAGERLNLPPGFPQRAVLLLAQAERLAAVLDVAAGDPHGGAIDRHGVQARAEALRPLTTAVRRARVAGYNALVTAG